MTWILVLVWITTVTPNSAPTTIGPFNSLESCQHTMGQILQMASDMRNYVPTQDARNVRLVSWRCISIRN